MKLVLLLYDRAIYGCRQNDLEITWGAIRQLINSLNMEVQPISSYLLSIYDYCAELAREKNFDAVATILQDIRDTWSSASMEPKTSENNK